LQIALKHNQDDFMASIVLAISYSMGGRVEEARAETAEVIRINPQFPLKYFVNTLPYYNQADLDLIGDALRKARLK
jgi:hypothetical protein